VLLVALVLSLAAWGAGCVDQSASAEDDVTSGAGGSASDSGGESEAAPDVQWQVGLGTDLEEHVHEGHETSDGGFIMIGHHAETEDFSGATDILVIKADGEGNEQWQRVLGTSGSPDVGYAVAETSDGYVLAVGLAEGARQRPALIGLDTAGQVSWQQSYSTDTLSGHGALRSVRPLEGGGFVATGYDGSPESGFLFISDDSQSLLVRADPYGVAHWERRFDLTQGTKVLPSSEGFTVLSTAWVEADGKDVQNMVLLLTDGDGTEESRVEIGGANNIQAFDFDATPDGYVLTGHTTGYTTSNWDCAVIRVDREGQELWVRTFGNPRGYDPAFIHDECYGVRSLPEGGVVAVGGTGDEYDYSASGHRSGSSDEWKSYVLRLDDDGELLYAGIYGGAAGPRAGNNAAEFVALTQDGGVVLFTDTDSDGEPKPNNFGLVKLIGR
jgi:hypothetical protein